MKRILAALLFAAFGTSAAWAEAPTCTGTNLLAKYKAEQPAGYEEVMREANAIPNGEAMFWKIEKQGVAPSWLLGTAHVSDDRVNKLTPAIENALLNARSANFEIAEIGDRTREAAAVMNLARYIVLPPGQSLWDLVPDDQEPQIRDNPNLPEGMSKTLFGYQPWFVATLISSPLCEKLREQAGLRGLDANLATMARGKGIPVEGLETVEEQMKILASMPLDQQTEFLLSAARGAKLVPDQFETLLALYDKRQLNALLPLMKRLFPMSAEEAKVYAYVEGDLIIKRNHVMSERAAPRLAEGNVFIAVGAMHLPGKEGLVELLRAAGYKVTPVN